ncbi:phospho-N-acetylmuramoyl-pentapeptide-transferase MraY [Thermoclostridium stercorarium subsp. stercorarium DSM 8532]|jgi:phospho-N-acetylmuramoyl-pentapeptide-transferase|uniref:Phospho-N-acetylmuramoyl-pentapeptide-transferase n=3 Tax=Thermoclostridium stercorarium TaxID=1510 RepID=L7VR63_THES1|nr:phospho-N-acetylmuramoyl-pentapeptide-transferase [Thermoclostridium stercorarium]AGC69144.1 phospho-N-acetylmuramoyl-pentapeptide-transferase MraY [Thermoclostridium stercorarium subsp. stercorarium DSM 8532]AGI40113.1 phospho-N-acetylmuramoyl-pentapeptide-transferase [Thermoclostridium stercorarium subsp. stercorarium DSM 8532]ANW99427.1 phospho-N-acetylmuramoyl-pentapeptide-transferase [Thermoclostridium stercorarium subsp. thermolacticum DSM 2910]ANX02052.1 phospho-N-acetylmuramoyl-penta
MNIPDHIAVFVIAFVIALITGIILIPVLRKLKFGQTIREEGPKTHLVKQGIPTMGGFIFLVPLAVVGGFYAFKDRDMLALILTTFGFALVGFVDDFLKVKRHNKDGLTPKQKMLGLLIVAACFTAYVVTMTNAWEKTVIPFIGLDNPVNVPVGIFIPFCIFILLAYTNAVNLTDGLDGLAGSITVVVLVFFTLVSMLNNEWNTTKLFCAILAGGCLGFLTFNLHPAKVFMGDVGSLALGGAVASVAILLQMPFVLVIAGMIYFIENVSVILQVAYFKRTGKRIFKMAPIHHHFELMGWKETKIVIAFLIATIFFCAIAFVSLR